LGTSCTILPPEAVVDAVVDDDPRLKVAATTEGTVVVGGTMEGTENTDCCCWDGNNTDDPAL
jgi:hypothetical protein